jgi:hypothetical protein
MFGWSSKLSSIEMQCLVGPFTTKSDILFLYPKSTTEKIVISTSDSFESAVFQIYY